MSAPIIIHRPAGIPAGEDFETLLARAATEGDRASHSTRFYDEGMRDWIRTVFAIGGRSIRTLQSTPMRAFGDMAEILRKENPDETHKYPIDAKGPARFPMPFAVFDRTSTKWRDNWGNTRGGLRNIAFIGGTEKRRTGYMRAPRPMNYGFQIDVYARMEAQMRWLIQRFEEQFNPMAYLRIRTPFLPEPEHLMAIQYGDSVDSSELEPGEGGDRVLRQTFTVVVEGWQWFDLMQAPTVQRFGQEGPGLEVGLTALADEAPPLTSDEIAALPSGSPGGGGVVPTA